MFPTFYLTLALFWLAPFVNQPATVQADYEDLVAAERRFAKAGIDNGIRDAFLANLDEKSVVFVQNQFRPGKATYEKSPAGPAKLSWRPNYAEIAKSGTLGFTTGPFELRPRSLEEVPVAYGQFTSVWQKTTTGNWKVLIDFGCTHEKPNQPAPELNPPIQFATKVMASLDTSVISRELRQVESLFAETARQKSLRDAYQPVLPTSDSIRLLRENHVPYEGAAAKRLAESSDQQIDYQPVQTITAPSGDLGFSYGYATFSQIKQAYLRIWRKRNGHWQLAQEVLSLKFT
ncbi:YybH family protein [Spirosoma jeollabukense]